MIINGFDSSAFGLDIGITNLLKTQYMLLGSQTDCLRIAANSSFGALWETRSSDFTQIGSFNYTAGTPVTMTDVITPEEFPHFSTQTIGVISQIDYVIPSNGLYVPFQVVGIISKDSGEISFANGSGASGYIYTDANPIYNFRTNNRAINIGWSGYPTGVGFTSNSSSSPTRYTDCYFVVNNGVDGMTVTHEGSIVMDRQYWLGSKQKTLTLRLFVLCNASTPVGSVVTSNKNISITWYIRFQPLWPDFVIV